MRSNLSKELAHLLCTLTLHVTVSALHLLERDCVLFNVSGMHLAMLKCDAVQLSDVRLVLRALLPSVCRL